MLVGGPSLASPWFRLLGAHACRHRSGCGQPEQQPVRHGRGQLLVLQLVNPEQREGVLLGPSKKCESCSQTSCCSCGTLPGLSRRE